VVVVGVALLPIGVTIALRLGEWAILLLLTVFFFFFGSTRVLSSGPHACWKEALLLEPLHHPFFVLGVFKIWSLLCLGWLWTMILLISVFWVARITGVAARDWQMKHSLKHLSLCCGLDHVQLYICMCVHIWRKKCFINYYLAHCIGLIASFFFNFFYLTHSFFYEKKCNCSLFHFGL
jgi:hypothetical protein